MDPQAATGRDAGAEVAAYLRQHPRLRGKAGLGLVTDVLGPTDWVSGPGDDAAAIPCPAGSGQAFVRSAAGTQGTRIISGTGDRNGETAR